MTWICDPSGAADSAHVGGKARALSYAARHGLASAPWFVITDTAPIDGDRLTNEAFERAVCEAVSRLCPNGELVAVRSSATDEDGVRLSFAGQLDSFLDVKPADVVSRVRDVRQSGDGDRVSAYRRGHGASSVRPPAVIIQRMVDARVAGIAFSADPISGRRGVAVVSAIAGTGAALASGAVNADTWRVDRNGTILERRIAADAQEGGGPKKAVLSDDEVRAVAALARAAERIFGAPQDVEWAMADRLVLLQSRPVTCLRSQPDPDATPAIWDNSNIVESYSGVTTPLTFSFVREIYPPVYREFCRMTGVPAAVIARHADVFQNVLGLVRGRLYYNLLNWHRILALLPGYRLNRVFMEQMMGVGQPLAREHVEAIAAGIRVGRLADAMRMMWTLAGLVVAHLTLTRRVAAFERRLDAALQPPSPPLEQARPDELVRHYRDLRQRLLSKWDAPIVNDFFAMLFYGACRRLVVAWCGDPRGTLQNDLIAGDGGMISAEPAALVSSLGKIAADDPELVECLCSGSAEAIAVRLQSQPSIAEGCERYLSRFGDRTINELKLESLTLRDDSLPLFRAIGACARQGTGSRGLDRADGEAVRMAARARASAALSGRPLKRLVFAWTLRQAQRRVRDRENLRLGRTRLFARVRQIFLELGRRLHAVNLLDEPRDIFLLEIEEVLAFVDGRSTCTDLRGLVGLRRQEFTTYERGNAPAERFETRGPVYHAHDYRASTPAATHSTEARHGQGASPGIVRGPVQIVTDPCAVDISRASILIATHTDPGWVMIFPHALGVIVERGSLLSHAAIVARELGVAAIVSLPGAMTWLRDGDWIEMDGTTGVVRLIDVESDSDRLSETDAHGGAEAVEREVVAHA